MADAAVNMMAESKSITEKIRLFLELIKFEHTIFALPFAYLGMVLAAGGLPTFHQFFWVTVAMASARTLAFAINRLADRRFDATNPRTAKRPSVTGALSTRTITVFAILSLAILALSAALLNPLTLLLFPGAVVFLLGYSYTKRFTSLCHWVLGFTDGLAPMGGWIAVRGSAFTAEDLPAWLLLFAVTFWISGFDLIYACQDVEHDQREATWNRQCVVPGESQSPADSAGTGAVGAGSRVGLAVLDRTGHHSRITVLREQYCQTKRPVPVEYRVPEPQFLRGRDAIPGNISLISYIRYEVRGMSFRTVFTHPSYLGTHY
jgi:hypothetical protein